MTGYVTIVKMQAWGVTVCLAALAVIQVFAEEPLAFPEDVSSLSSARIVSGWDADEGQIPWQLSLRMVNPTGAVSACGGSIIHPEWGITAAHCTATRVTMVLRAGAVSLTRPELIFETTEYWNHPLYNDAFQTVVQPHDIAILKFPQAITFSDRVQPIRLQKDEDKDRNYDGVRLEASGWGRTWTDGASPDHLQWVYLTGDSNLACWFAFGGSSIIVDSTICASAYNVTSQSTCSGDSGGPLVDLDKDGKYTLVGIASFVSGAGCHADFPAGFVRPGHYHSWYTEITGLDFSSWEYEEIPTEAPSTEPTTEAESSSEESEETTEGTTEEPTTEAENSSEESEETTEGTTEEPTTEAQNSSEESEETTEGTTEEPTTEAENSSEESEETTEGTTEEPTTEAENSTEESEETTEGTTEEATTEAENSSEESEETTEGTTEEPTTEADISSESKSSESSAETEETTEAASTEDATTEEESAEAASEEDEDVTEEEASTEDATPEETTEAESDEEDTEETRNIFSYLRGLARF